MAERLTEKELIEIETSATATLEWEEGEFDADGVSKACHDLLKLVAEVRALSSDNERLKSNWNIVSKRFERGVKEVNDMAWAVGQIAWVKEGDAKS